MWFGERQSEAPNMFFHLSVLSRASDLVLVKAEVLENLNQVKRINLVSGSLKLCGRFACDLPAALHLAYECFSIKAVL